MVRRSHCVVRGAMLVWSATAIATSGCANEELAPDVEEESIAEAEDEPELELANLPADPHEAFAHEADVPDVVVFWDALPEGVEARDELVLVLESHVDEPRVVIPRVFVSGLDDRQGEVELASVELLPRERIEIPVRLDALPVQGASHSVTLIASGEFDNAGDTVAVQAQPLAYHFDDDFSNAYVYTLDTMVTELHGGQLSDDPRHLHGLVDEGDGFRSTTELSLAAAEGGTSPDETIPAGVESIEYTYEISSPDELAGAPDAFAIDRDPVEAGDGGEGGDSPVDPPPPAAWCSLVPWDCCEGDSCVDVCVDWSTTFVDASSAAAATKEDYGVGAATQVVDASYAEFSVTKVTCGPIYCFSSTVDSGILGPNGCAEVDLPPGSGYTMKVKTRLHHGGGGNQYPIEWHPQNDPTSNVGVVQLSKSFTVPIPGSPLPPPFMTLPFHEAGNAAAAMSRTLASGAVVDQPSGFTTLAGLGCLNGGPGIPTTDACAGGSLKTGPYTKPDNSPGMLRWKFVLAHEAGHIVQDKGMGIPSYAYCFTPAGVVTTNCAAPNTGDPPGAPASCSCGHVSGTNGLHCLQSIERTSSAIVEGYAQFFATRVWNNPDSGALFRYYKQFRNENGTVTQPPLNVSSSTFSNWRDNHCFDELMSTELDWLQFFWNLHAIGSFKYSMGRIFDVFGDACNGSCEGQNVTWDMLDAGAASFFGNGSNEHNKLVTTGDNAGVDDSEF
jgi:hypothetical protein